MKQNSRKIPVNYGQVIECYLTADRRSRPEAYIKLINAVAEMAERLIHSLGLKAVATENQMQQAQDHLLKEITTEPAQFTPGNLRRKPPCSITYSEFIRSKILLKPEKYLASIQSYTYSRLKTLLREYAEEEGKCYIRFRNRTRDNLNKLADDGAVLETKPGFWSTTNNPKFFCKDSKLILPLKLPGGKADLLTAKNHYADSLKRFLRLPEHFDTAFSLKVITEFFYNNYVSKTIPESETLIKESQPHSETGEKIGNEEYGQYDHMFDEIGEAIDAEKAFANLLQCSNHWEPEAQQTLMAGLAYFALSNPDYFERNPLSQTQLSLPIVDGVENFLNDRRFRHLNKWSISRGTANNRLNAFKDVIKKRTEELSHIAKRQFVRIFCSYLLKEFDCLTRGGSK